MTIRQVPLAWLVEDSSVYPRGSVSMMRVDDLVQAMETGRDLPPPVADEDTGILVDGFHRTRALRRRLGDDAYVDVDVRQFADPAAMLLASVELNAGHGLPLSRYDKKVIILRARAAGISDEETARAMAVPIDKLLKISVMVAQAPDGGRVPLKNGTSHLAGHVLTDAQLSALRSHRGGTAKQKAQELTRMIDSGIAPVGHDPELRIALAALRLEIEEALAPFGEE